MAKRSRKLMFELDEWDQDLLRCISRSTGMTATGVVRWALRFYAVNGPWCDTDRKKILRKHQKRVLDIGPNNVEVK